MSGAIASMGSGRNTPNHAFFLSALPCIRAIGSLNTRGCGIQPRNDYLIRCRTFLRSNARLCVCVARGQHCGRTYARTPIRTQTRIRRCIMQSAGTHTQRNMVVVDWLVERVHYEIVGQFKWCRRERDSEV